MTTKTISRCVCGLMAAATFTACGGNGLEGKWVEPVPSMENQV